MKRDRGSSDSEEEDQDTSDDVSNCNTEEVAKIKKRKTEASELGLGYTQLVLKPDAQVVDPNRILTRSLTLEIRSYPDSRPKLQVDVGSKDKSNMTSIKEFSTSSDISTGEIVNRLAGLQMDPFDEPVGSSSRVAGTSSNAGSNNEDPLSGLDPSGLDPSSREDLSSSPDSSAGSGTPAS